MRRWMFLFLVSCFLCFSFLFGQGKEVHTVHSVVRVGFPPVLHRFPQPLYSLARECPQAPRQ